MAGTIFVTYENAVALSSIVFDRLGDAIRRHFGADERAVATQVYWHHDEGGMSAISADGLHPDEFSVFVRAVRGAHKEARTADDFSLYKEYWDELEGLIVMDPRYDPAAVP